MCVYLTFLFLRSFSSKFLFGVDIQLGLDIEYKPLHNQNPTSFQHSKAHR